MCLNDDLNLKCVISLMGRSHSTLDAVNHEESCGERRAWSSNDQSLTAHLVRSHVATNTAAVIVPFRSDATLSAVYQHVASITPKMFRRLNSRLVMKDLADEGVIRTPALELMSDGARASYDHLANSLGSPFIVKGDGSVSGAECFLVSDRGVLDKAVRRCGDRLNTAWQYIAGTSLNFHYVCYEAGSAVLPPSQQILTTAAKETPFQFAGSDFDVEVSEDGVANARRQVEQLATALQRSGYRGFGGADVVVANDGQTFVVDLNPRLQGSSLPLSRGLSASLGITVGQLQVMSIADEAATSVHRLAELPLVASDWGGQMFVRNDSSQSVVAGVLPDGVYRRTPDGWVASGQEDWHGIGRDELLVLDSAPPALPIRRSGMVCRLVFSTGGHAEAASFASMITTHRVAPPR